MATGIKFKNRIARINLTTGECKSEVMDSQDARHFVGGVGTAMQLLYKEVPANIDPLSAENKIFFTAGPLNGTKINGTGIVNVSGKSPLTGYIISAQANGFFGARMRFAGFETIIVEGQAPDWCYIWIDDGKIEIRDARHLHGKGTWETEKLIKEEIGRPRASVGCIGPAGENLVRFACTMFDSGHAASTNGSGCLLGSKRCKAVVVSAAQNVVDIFDPELNTTIRKEFIEDASDNDFARTTIIAGTHGTLPFLYKGEVISMKNYSTVKCDNIEDYYWENRHKYYEKKKEPCWACPWAHCGSVKVIEGKAKGYEGEEPEYEALIALTLNIGAKDIGEACRLLHINEDMGYDIKELTFTISLLMECYEKGIIDKETTGGLDFSWGNTDTVETVIRSIYKHEGFCGKLDKGVKKTAEMIGGEAVDIGVYLGRGNAPHVIDGRAIPSIVSAFAVAENGSVFGGTSTNPDLDIDDPIKTPEQVFNNLHKGVRKRYIEDMVGMCDFYQHGHMDILCKAIAGSTGWEGFDRKELLKAAERTMNVARAYNCLSGLTPEVEGSPSKRAITSPSDSRNPGNSFFDKNLLPVYYHNAGWDIKTSKPLPDKLKELDLEYMIPDLWPEA